MMLVTKCPNCHTVFKVVSDQLKISEGWVRCGQCNDIFDTALNLREWDPQKPEDNIPPSIVSHEEMPHPAVIPRPAAPPLSPLTQQALAEPFDDSLIQVADDRSAVNALSGHVPEPMLIEEVLPELDDPPHYIDFADEVPEPELESHSHSDAAPLPTNEPTFDSLDDPPQAPEMAPFDGSGSFRDFDGVTEHPDRLADAPFAERRNPGLASDDFADQGVDAVRPESISFMRDSRANSFWQRPGVQRALGVAVILLLLLLFVQFIMQERDRIASSMPALKPLLADICQPLGCKVLPLRQIESMTVESSSFNRFRGETYRLGFVIRNTADLELARPALELTLTDSQEQPVYRRVLLPAELDGKSATMTRGEEWSEALTISLASSNPAATAGLGKNVTGYRLLAFYP